MKHRSIKNIDILKPHERSAAFLLREKGFDIEVLIPSNTPRNKNADFLINGRIWELKSPQKNRRETIERCFKKASKQSENLLIDLHGLPKTDETTLKIIESRFRYSRSIKRLIVLTKDGELLRYE
ncbi:hypothetical protein IK110_01065 [Candidatus Saccharibacteria bacterium]|nr:hypothetical protein [Candidatus Saccharibacteria bacterium]